VVVLGSVSSSISIEFSTPLEIGAESDDEPEEDKDPSINDQHCQRSHQHALSKLTVGSGSLSVTPHLTRRQSLLMPKLSFALDHSNHIQHPLAPSRGHDEVHVGGEVDWKSNGGSGSLESASRLTLNKSRVGSSLPLKFPVSSLAVLATYPVIQGTGPIPALTSHHPFGFVLIPTLLSIHSPSSHSLLLIPLSFKSHPHSKYC
jgi:hypothetical protein